MFHPAELLSEWETRTNRSYRRRGDPDALLALWSAAGSAAPPVFSDGGGECELMVVLTTYGRPEAAETVLERLRSALERAPKRARVLVLHDACGRDYAAARAAAGRLNVDVVWLDARARLGKAGFWRLHQTALLAAQAWRPERALYLQDDVDFEADLLERCDFLWQATAHDPRRRVLYLVSCDDDERHGRWVYFPRSAVPGVAARLINWFDLQAFMVDRAFFELLDYRIVPIHPNRWKRRPEISSGVGRQLTLRLFRRAHIYQAWPSLVRHGGQPSTMNPEARALRPLDNR
jgi:hypothetical protein